MGYVNTIAFNTESTARHGGDPGWIRHANGRIVSNVRGSDLRGVEEVGTIANTLAQLATTFASLRQAKMDNKAAKNDAAGQERIAAAAAAESATVAAAQAAAQSLALEKAAQPEAKSGKGGVSTKTLEIGGAAAAVLGIGLVIFFMRRKA